MKYYDRVNRKVKLGGDNYYILRLYRFRCTNCRSIHRFIPPCLYSNKHYNRRIIDGFLSKKLNKNDILYEDYPTDLTVCRWTKNLHAII